MLKKQLSLLLIAAMFSLGADLAFAQDRFADSETQRVAAVKSEILKLGTGPDARIKLKLRDNTKVEGYVSETNADTFTVVNLKSGMPTVVAYPQVGTAKGNNLSDGARTAIFIGIAVGLTILAIKYGRRRRRVF